MASLIPKSLEKLDAIITKLTEKGGLSTQKFTTETVVNESGEKPEGLAEKKETQPEDAKLKKEIKEDENAGKEKTEGKEATKEDKKNKKEEGEAKQEDKNLKKESKGEKKEKKGDKKPEEEKEKKEAKKDEKKEAKNEDKKTKNADKEERKPTPQEIVLGPLTEELKALFARVELRVGQFIEVTRVENSDKLYRSHIDFNDYKRIILSGLQKGIPIEGMKGKLVAFTNLKPRKMAGQFSEGMVIVASQKPEIFELVRPDESVPVGTRICLEGADIPLDKVDKELDPNHLFTFLDFLRTDESGTVCFGKTPMTAGGKRLLSSSLKNAPVS